MFNGSARRRTQQSWLPAHLPQPITSVQILPAHVPANDHGYAMYVVATTPCHDGCSAANRHTPWLYGGSNQQLTVGHAKMAPGVHCIRNNVCWLWSLIGHGIFKLVAPSMCHACHAVTRMHTLYAANRTGQHFVCTARSANLTWSVTKLWQASAIYAGTCSLSLLPRALVFSVPFTATNKMGT